MGAIAETFERLHTSRQVALIPFITCGDPDLETTRQSLFTLAQHGADLIEVGMPYGDPLADGPVIQAAATRALKRGVTWEDVRVLLGEVVPNLATPVILFSYYNPVLALGAEIFLGQLQALGVRGLVIPDLPLEESGELLRLSKHFGVELILLVAPTSPPARIAQIAAQAQGFIYLVSLTGTTGVRSQLSELLPSRIAYLHSVSDKPIAVGFGIATADQARQVAAWGADGVIVGSACVRLLDETPADQRQVQLAKFCQSLRQALDAQSPNNDIT